MKYKMIYSVIHFDNNGDEFGYKIMPLIYDSRHLMTRKKIIDIMKNRIYGKIKTYFYQFPLEGENRVVERNEEQLRAIDILPDKILDFNVKNNLKLIGSISSNYEEEGLYVYAEIFESDIEYIKDNNSEMSNLKPCEAQLNENYNNMEDLKIKDIVYVPEYNICVHYDFEDRNSYDGGYPRMSKNLSLLVKTERKNFDIIARSFYIENYKDEYVIDEIIEEFNKIKIRDNLRLYSVNKDGSTDSNSVCQKNNNISFGDDNGVFINCYIQQIPIVSYTGR